MKVIVDDVEYSGPAAPSMIQDFAEQIFAPLFRKWGILGGDLFVAPSSFVLKLVAVELSTAKFTMKSVDVFPLVAMAYVALTATCRKQSFLYCVLAI